MYQLVIGLEVHIQPSTKSKMFCGCNAKYFGSAPNTFTCPICLGLPGALPVPNKVAIEKCLKLGLALNCKINKQSKFDRKHYFYPDLPKGYQISQYDLPFCYEGFLEIDTDKDAKRIRITRIHMEEDTAKSIHNETETLIDINKSGVPLIELVSEPDFQDIKEVLTFAKRLRQIVRYLNISTADMEKGQMRFELNMSLKKPGDKGLPKYKVEVKNISSISVLEKVINYEYERQSKLLDEGQNPDQETRGLRDLTGKTHSQRKKEVAEDYRYFPEPDIPPINVDEKWLESIKNEIRVLPQEKKYRFIETYKLEPSTAETIISTKNRALWFEDALKDEKDYETIALFGKWFIRDVLGMVKIDKIKLKDLKFNGDDLLELVKMISNGELSGTLAKQVLEEMYRSGAKVKDIVEKRGLKLVSDEGELGDIVDLVLKDNSKILSDIDKNPNIIKFLLGGVMKMTKGKADPQKAMKLIEEKLSKN